MSAPALVIGVGNRDRGDDAIGPVVADAVYRRHGAAVEHLVLEGDLSDLAIAWRSDQAVVIVDAMVSGRRPGTILELDGLEVGRLKGTGISTHGFGVGEGVRLAKLLNRLPESLTVIAVEAATFELFRPLSDQVADAIPEVLTRIDRLLLAALTG